MPTSKTQHQWWSMMINEALTDSATFWAWAHCGMVTCGPKAHAKRPDTNLFKDGTPRSEDLQNASCSSGPETTFAERRWCCTAEVRPSDPKLANLTHLHTFHFAQTFFGISLDTPNTNSPKIILCRPDLGVRQLRPWNFKQVECRRAHEPVECLMPGDRSSFVGKYVKHCETAGSTGFNRFQSVSIGFNRFQSVSIGFNGWTKRIRKTRDFVEPTLVALILFEQDKICYNVVRMETDPELPHTPAWPPWSYDWLNCSKQMIVLKVESNSSLTTSGFCQVIWRS